jgi:hypothetical protein
MTAGDQVMAQQMPPEMPVMEPEPQMMEQPMMEQQPPQGMM